MNLGEAKKKSIQHINEFSNNGNLISPSANSDYTLRLHSHANDAQMQLSNRVDIETSYTITQVGASENGYNKYTLPIDFKQNIKINKDDELFTDYRIENRKLLVAKWYDGTFEQFYYKHPAEIDDDTPDSYEFEIDKQYHYLIPYYMAGMVAMDEPDKKDVSDKLLNIFYEGLGGAKKATDDYPKQIQSIYGI